VLDRCERIYPRRLLENYAVWPGQSSKVDWTVVDVLTASQGENTSELTAVQYRRMYIRRCACEARAIYCFIVESSARLVHFRAVQVNSY